MDTDIDQNYLIIFLTIAALASILILDQIKTTKIVFAKVNDTYINSLETKSNLKVELKRKNIKPKVKETKGVYLTARSAGSEEKLEEIISLINSTQLNSVVIDIKHYTGKVLYDSDIELVNDLNLEENRLGDIEKIIDKLHRNDIYVIARQSVFQDPALAEVKPDWAVKNKQGEVWKNKNGISWSNPNEKEVWKYNIDIAKEAVDLGFDEINFDYVRFPSDGDTSRIRPKLSRAKKKEIIASFFDFVKKEMKNEPVRTSLDLFGMVMEREGGLRIGQRLKDTVEEVDYVSPMMYPSHYPPGHMGFSQPAKYPGKVLRNGLKQGDEYFEDSRAKLRPWIQAFSLDQNYDREKVQAQIKAVEDHTDGGWLLWDARNVYNKQYIASTTPR